MNTKVLLWSKQQNCFHIEPMSQLLMKNLRAFVNEKSLNDYHLIGTGTDMLLPQDRSGVGSNDSAADAARRSFAETFGQISQQTVSKNLDAQPTLKIRPGYRFNVLVDQDIVFPRAYP